jgi:antirestriction protein ArdC
MPERTAFDHDLGLVSTLAHEVTHASGHVDRLARETLRDYHKERSVRAREELVAELGASYLMADLGLAYTPRPDHAAYLASWLGALRHDPRRSSTPLRRRRLLLTGSTRRTRLPSLRWRSQHEARHGHRLHLA